MEVDEDNAEQYGDVGSFSYTGHHLHAGFVYPYGEDMEDQPAAAVPTHSQHLPPTHFQHPDAPEAWAYPGEKTASYYTWENEMLLFVNETFGAPKKGAPKNRSR